MNRLMIVDNEHIVVDSLLHAFEKHPELNLEVLGAYSADEALSFMERAKVDILVTDIKMPGMSGLELQREVAQRWPWCRTLFLTGYNDFTFVQEAIRLGGVEYLLKTEGTDAIIAAVAKAAAQIDSMRRRDELLHRAEELVARARPLLQHKLLISLLNGWTDVKGALDQFESYGIGLRKDGAWMIYARFDDMSETGELGYDVALAAIESSAKDYLGAPVQFIQVEHTRGALVWLVSFDNDWRERRRLVYLQGVTEAVQEHLSNKLGIHISASISREPVNWRDMPGTLQRLAYMLNLTSYIGGRDGVQFNILLTVNHETDAAEYVNEAVRDRLNDIRHMDAYLECGAKFEFHDALDELVKLLANASATARLEAYHSVLAMLVRHINRWDLTEFIAGNFELGALESRMSWNERMRALSKLADTVFEAKRLSGAKAGDDLIARVNRYIDNNPGGDLSLLQLGEMEGMNPFYLAHLYKKLTGESLKSYINAKRAEKACELLRHSELLNREIAISIGFQTEQSFYRFFKKMCGMTPKEYRDKHGVQNG